ncbi:hypothetical protein [Vibrio phage VpKK5]|uniref:hypothetical protein n=1 Tax=Vibrio phage VpKK5 TaxID=1538804 RepID=UPI0004F58B9E|nr:hypothetical protein VC55_gp04 [Vibrio phage VpKK5]AIM40588.1 hypothetical protein [Vibrio phage VpKK5]
MRKVIPFEADTLVGVIKRLPKPRDFPDGYVIAIEVINQQPVRMAHEGSIPCTEMVYKHHFKRISYVRDGEEFVSWELMV